MSLAWSPCFFGSIHQNVYAHVGYFYNACLHMSQILFSFQLIVNIEMTQLRPHLLELLSQGTAVVHLLVWLIKKIESSDGQTGSSVFSFPASGKEVENT